ncbi:MAG: radical SAM protein [Thermoplasmatota archaeon]
MTFRVYEPCPGFPPVSLSRGCRLGCRHCRGRHLDGMTHVAPSELYGHALALADRGARGMLVSGGSDSQGRLLHLGEALDVLAAIRRDTGLLVAVHAGIVDAALASRLAEACDVAFVDVVGSDETAREVIGLESAAPYRYTMEALVDAGVPVTPHVTVGLHGGRIVGERAAIDFVAALPVERMVVNVICPTPGTSFASVMPPPADMMASLLEYAVERCGRVALGCMRPRGRPDIERAAIDAGVRDMVLPSRETLERFAVDGIAVERLSGCCGLPRRLV